MGIKSNWRHAIATHYGPCTVSKKSLAPENVFSLHTPVKKNAVTKNRGAADSVRKIKVQDTVAQPLGARTTTYAGMWCNNTQPQEVA